MSSHSSRWPTRRVPERCALFVGAALALACGDAQHRIGNGPGGLDDLDNDGAAEARVGRCDWRADIEIIDDLEDDDYAFRTRGRAGTWFPFNDESEDAVQEPRPNATVFPIAELEPTRRHSRHAVHTFGSGFTLWGGGVGLDIDQKRAYDASGYAGIVFFARSGGEPLVLRADVTDLYTSPLGMRCVELPPDVAPSNGEVPCFANHGRWVELTDEWQAFVVEWHEMSPKFEVDGAEPLEIQALYSIQFQTSDGTSEFDFYVDDVAFLCRPR